MTNKANAVVSLTDLPLDSFSRGTGYQSRDGGISEVLGLVAIGAAYTEVDPGKSACPFHVHHVEDELFVILEGEGSYRFGDSSYPVKAGDCLGAPAGGPEVAHQLINTGATVLKYLSISSKSDMDVCEYPDSRKFMVTSRRSSDTPLRYIGRHDTNLDYWDGEKDS